MMICKMADGLRGQTAPRIGAYPRLVQTRERLEHKIGKPLAAAYAMLHNLRREDPVRIRYDNKTMQT
jgi:hypothetical protein